MRYDRQQLREIGELLHDAVLRGVAWERARGTIALRFDCLRGNTDGSEFADRVVELRFGGVRAVAVGYDSASLEARPSRFAPARRISADELARWPFRPQEAPLAFDAEDVEDAVDSARVDWLAGDESALRASPSTFCLTFEQWREFGEPLIHVRLVAGGDDLVVTSGGAPLDLGAWAAQFGAWWEGWREHWAARNDERREEGGDDDDDADDGPVGGGARGAYDAAIPAGEPERADLSYRPPAEPVFDLEPSDVPADLVRPIRDWFEGHHARAWGRMAAAFPNPHESPQERAAQLEELHTADDFGRWGYARVIDGWWREGRRACVVVRGVQHRMAMEGDPAENMETVWSFALRHRVGAWVIQTYSEGWPGFGSAPSLPERGAAWQKKWRSGFVR